MTLLTKKLIKTIKGGRFLTFVVLPAMLFFGTVSVADTAVHADDHHGHGNRGHGGYHREYRGHRDYTGGYYAAPPVVYGQPYGYEPEYHAPPVAYSPGISVNIGIP